MVLKLKLTKGNELNGIAKEFLWRKRGKNRTKGQFLEDMLTDHVVYLILCTDCHPKFLFICLVVIILSKIGNFAWPFDLLSFT